MSSATQAQSAPEHEDAATMASRLRVPQDFVEQAPTRREILQVRVEKLGKHDWVRVSPDPEHCLSVGLIVVEGDGAYAVDGGLLDQLRAGPNCRAMFPLLSSALLLLPGWR